MTSRAKSDDDQTPTTPEDLGDLNARIAEEASAALAAARRHPAAKRSSD